LNSAVKLRRFLLSHLLGGMPETRALARARESIRLCAESDRIHRQSMRDFLRAPPTVTDPRPTR
jgi:hypothetical protein